MEQSNAEPLLRRYEHLLATAGIERGLIGPREADRLWERHIRNCAVVAEDPAIVPRGATVVDVGSGAGLPGVVWAIVRPDLRVTLVESLLRRVTFLTEVVAELALSERVTVLRGRAEELGQFRADVATARAVAPLPRLLPWLAPLVTVGTGQILAFKGASVASEVSEAAHTAVTLGLSPAEVLEVGQPELDPPSTVVRYLRLRT